MHKPRLLVCTDWYDPAFKAGGPIRSCVNLVAHLHNIYDIYVFTGDRDLDEPQPLPGIIKDQWIEHATGAKVWYASSEKQGLADIRGMLEFVRPQYLYLNSAFSKIFTIDIFRVARKIGLSGKLILSPRGMLKPSALAIKPLKKKVFLLIARLLGVSRSLHFHATNQIEAEEITSIFGKSDVTIAPNFPAPINSTPKPLEKNTGFVRLLLVGRIHPIKNIDFLIRQLPAIQGEVLLNIIGVAESSDYEEQCLQLISVLPPDKKVNMMGEMPHSLLEQHISSHHLFVLPTKGENYGHAIAESLGNGRPVLISDQTPWRNLAERKAGWDCSISHPDCFRKALQDAVDWNQADFDMYCQGALDYIKDQQDTTKLINKYKQLFN
ncbi:glycosyltransferase [Flavihumibacter sp. ZG627]|uniref:glycosyltransferase n=1 Tax=Flavihumibacter sp. ZG627 TaxID=1463156 RepID=UPI00057F132F|nr:glycosyltransferase [Flavihumibacter sp. ZG627]KIC92274.1 hypothetical protein HY58_01615 [Flavihumibacter sp. ZG627]